MADISQVELYIHVYQPIDNLNENDPIIDLNSSQNGGSQDSDGESEVMVANVIELPSLNLEGVWDNLIYDGDIKNRLLNVSLAILSVSVSRVCLITNLQYIYSTILFSDAKIDFNVITWHR